MQYNRHNGIPCFGFGGDPKTTDYPKGVSHCFPLSGKKDTITAFGI